MTNGILFLFGFYDTPSSLFVNVARSLEHGLGDFESVATLNGAEKAGPITFVTSGADLLDLDQQSVAIAIERDVFDGLGVAAFLAFHPEFLAGAAPKMGLAGGDGFFQGSSVHPRHHQNAASAGFLHDGGNEAVGVKFQFVVKAHFSSTHFKRKLANLNEKVERPRLKQGKATAPGHESRERSESGGKVAYPPRHRGGYSFSETGLALPPREFMRVFFDRLMLLRQKGDRDRPHTTIADQAIFANSAS
jgi:hypothetical protein